MAPERISLFLNLPLELRLHIYEYVWVPLPDCIHPKTHTLPFHVAASTSAESLRLLLVCRQIYAEASRIAFSRHTFLLTRSLTRCPPPINTITPPHNYIRSLLLPAYRPPSPCPTPYPVRCYTFREICALVRRFRNLLTIIIASDEQNLSEIQRSMVGWRAHVDFRMKKARRLSDERFSPSYGLRGLDGDGINVRGWRLSVLAGDGTVRSADLLLCGLAILDGYQREEERDDIILDLPEAYAVPKRPIVRAIELRQEG